eukprot:3511233-Amphidinium_carterae.1
MQTKYRTIDDHSECWNNRSARRMQKIPMASTLYSNFASDVQDDMQSAYRQIPLSDASLSMATTMVTHPSSRPAAYHELFGQPFGAAHAVTNFYRVAEWLYSARTCLHAFFEILGFVLDPAKSQPQTPTPTVLGIVFNLSRINEDIIQVQPKPDRVSAFLTELELVLASRCLTPSQAGKLVGKLDLLNSTLFGRVGRAALAPLCARQHQHTRDAVFTAVLEQSLHWICGFLRTAP